MNSCAKAALAAFSISIKLASSSNSHTAASLILGSLLPALVAYYENPTVPTIKTTASIVGVSFNSADLYTLVLSRKYLHLSSELLVITGMLSTKPLPSFPVPPILLDSLSLVGFSSNLPKMRHSYWYL